MAYDPNPIFEVGDKIVCTGSRGYAFTVGKEYTVLEYEPVCSVPHYTWPAYVVVEDDYGIRSHCHARRFYKKED